MANIQLAKPKPRSLTKLSTAGLVPSSQPAIERKRLGEQLIFKMRMLANQPMLDDQQLQIAGEIWADELIKAGIPPRLWDQMISLARRARPSSSKAFEVKIDQTIDAWEHYLHGYTWIIVEQAWEECKLL